MNKIKLSVLTLAALAIASIASAQLIVTPTGPTTLSAAINASASDQTKLDTIGLTNPDSVVLGGLTFSAIPNLDSYTVSPGFFADVSFVGRMEIDVDNLFVQGDVGAPVSLYAPYGAGSSAFSFHLTGNSGFTLMHQDLSFGAHSLVSQIDPLTFKFYEAIDVAANRIYDLVLVDDRNSLQYTDFNDGRFLVEQNLNPVGIEPVPEASTYGVAGAAVLLAIVAFRRLRAREDSASSVLAE